MEEKAGGISPPTPIHLVLTPSQRAALQAILDAQRNPRLLNPWYSDATITFDHYPANFTPIPSGTDLAFSQPYALGYGVEFTSLPAGKAVYAVSAAHFSAQSGNVVSLNNYYPTDPTKYSTFTGSDGTIVATFAAPVNWVTIDTWPYSPYANLPSDNTPYLQALDASMNILATNLASPPVPNTWQTLPAITRPQADISAVAFSVLGGDAQPVGAVFDNLHFKRPTP
jgi:hypothetical protein